jgi:hypothetical protein
MSCQPHIPAALSSGKDAGIYIFDKRHVAVTSGPTLRRRRDETQLNFHCCAVIKHWVNSVSVTENWFLWEQTRTGYLVRM